MKLTERQQQLMKEAGINVPADTAEYRYTADNEDSLADLLLNSLNSNQDWTKKAGEIRDLLNYLADFD